jgi:hypothetical protein
MTWLCAHVRVYPGNQPLPLTTDVLGYLENVLGPACMGLLAQTCRRLYMILFLHFCEARFAGLSPWFAPVRRVGVGGGGLHFGLVRRALFIFAPRSTPNKLILTAVTLFSQGRVVAWPLAVAAGERQHAIPHCLGSRAAFQASLSPISTQ